MTTPIDAIRTGLYQPCQEKLLNMSNQPIKRNMPCTPCIQGDFINPSMTTKMQKKQKNQNECAQTVQATLEITEFFNFSFLLHAFYAACKRVIRRACIFSFLRFRASHPSSSSDADIRS